jgi:hypothetical protein
VVLGAAVVAAGVLLTGVSELLQASKKPMMPWREQGLAAAGWSLLFVAGISAIEPRSGLKVASGAALVLATVLFAGTVASNFSYAQERNDAPAAFVMPRLSLELAVFDGLPGAEERRCALIEDFAALPSVQRESGDRVSQLRGALNGASRARHGIHICALPSSSVDNRPVDEPIGWP